MTNGLDPSFPIAPQIYLALRGQIVAMELLPGQALSEKEVAARFGVSRQPVREAFIKLSEAGLVRILPQRGTFVVRISVRDVANARFVREAVEVAVARAACRVAHTDALDRLDAIVGDQRRTAERSDHAGFLRLDEEFHKTLAEAVDCPSAWPIIEDVKAQMDRVRWLSLPYASPIAVLIDQHAAILAAIRRRDEAGAVDAMQRHLREILKALPQLAAEHPSLFDDGGLPAHAAALAEAATAETADA